MQTHTPSVQVSPHTSDHGTPRRAAIIWAVLMAATVLTWSVGVQHMSGPVVAAALFSVAFVKGALIILDYMALRRAPLMWPAIALGWMGFVCVMIGLGYWKGLAA